MSSQREVGLSFLALALNLLALPAVAHPAEPVVETRLADPDPGFVAAPVEKKSARLKRRSDDENPTLDQAFENLGRVTGALAQKMGAQYRPSDADLKAAQERLRQRLQEQAANPGE